MDFYNTHITQGMEMVNLEDPAVNIFFLKNVPKKMIFW